MATTAETATAPVVKDETANRPTTASLYVGELGNIKILKIGIIYKKKKKKIKKKRINFLKKKN